MRRLGAAVLGIVFLAGCGGGPERGEQGGAVPPGAAPLPSGETPGPDPRDGQGTVRLLPDDPVPASSLGSWTVEWIAGPDGLPTGGGAVLQVSPFWGWSPPQVDRPGRPGYTTASCADPGVRLELEDPGVPMALVARVVEGRLEAGDVLRFVYGDSTSGGPGSLSRVDRYAEAFEELLIKTDGNGDGFFVAPPDQPTLRILPGPLARLAVAAPAVVAPGEGFEARLSALDALGSRTDFPDGTWALAARPLAPGPADPAGEPLVLASGTVPPGEPVRARVRVDEPGLYRLEAAFTAGGERRAGRGDLLLVEAGGPFAGILWGDIHCHSALSDGTGSPEELYAFAREVAGLDVCAVTDHDAHGLFPLAERGGWERVRRATEAAYAPGRFVTLLGYEWTNWTFGHRNVYYPGAEGDVFTFREPESNRPETLWERIAPFGGMTVAHHSGGGPIAIDWSVPTPAEREAVVEICSIHGSSEAMDVEHGIYRPVPAGMVRAALARGHELGILASGDTHDGHPGHRSAGASVNGLAAFRTAGGARTREAVWAAMRTRQVYGTTGPRILLATRWGDTAPGTRLSAVPDAPLVVRICAPEPLEVVELIGPGGVLASSYGGGRRAEKRFFEAAPPPAGLPWFYVRVVLADGEAAWESPYWLPEEG